MGRGFKVELIDSRNEKLSHLIVKEIILMRRSFTKEEIQSKFRIKMINEFENEEGYIEFLNSRLDSLVEAGLLRKKNNLYLQ